MVKYFLLYFYLILIVSSILGYGFLLANFLNKNLLKYNLGYIGILGLLIKDLIYPYVNNVTFKELNPLTKYKEQDLKKDK